MAQLSRARDRQMHSIVATIQAEQDRAIRAPSRGVVSISGGPGTGKTVVALHRAAYLLYTDRRRYEARRRPGGRSERRLHALHRAGAPGLGETAVALRSLGEVVDGAARHPARRAGGRRHQGLGPDGRPAAAGRAAAGARQPERVPDLLARRRARPRPRQPGPGPPAADVPGPAQPAAATGRRGAARRAVEPGPRRARPGARPRGVRGRAAGATQTSSTSCWPGGRRSTRRPCSAGCATPSCLPRPRRTADPRGAAAARQVVGAAASRRRPSRTSRWSTSCATRSATCRSAPTTTATLDDPLEGARPAGADDRGRPGVRADRAGLGAAHPPDRGRRLRARARRRGAGPHADAVADGRPPRPRPRPGRSSATPPSRRGRCPRRRQRPGPTALEGKQLHEFHLSTNYRNSAEIYEFAAAYAERVGLDADLPTAVRSTGVAPREVTGVADLETATREAVPTSPAGSRAPSASWCPVARRSEVNAWLASWPSSPTTPRRPRRDRLLGRAVRRGPGRRTDRARHQGPGVRRHRGRPPDEIEAESVTGRATLYVALTRATQLLTTVS